MRARNFCCTLTSFSGELDSHAQLCVTHINAALQFAVPSLGSISWSGGFILTISWNHMQLSIELPHAYRFWIYFDTVPHGVAYLSAFGFFLGGEACSLRQSTAHQEALKTGSEIVEAQRGWSQRL